MFFITDVGVFKLNETLNRPKLNSSASFFDLNNLKRQLSGFFLQNLSASSRFKKIRSG